MAESSSHMFQQSGDPNNQQQRNQHPLANYQFSADELRVLRECNRDSFFQRSVPLGTIMGLGAYFGVNKGYFAGNAKYGAVPKVIVGVIVGYFIGKFSYQQKCAEKLMQLPNSKLAEVLRQKKKGGMYSVLTPEGSVGAGLALSPFNATSADIYSDEYARPLNLDADNRPANQGLDDSFRPTVDDSSPNFETNLSLEPSKQSVTYDELRKKNREDYSKKSQTMYSKPLGSDAPTIFRQNDRPSTSSNDNPAQLPPANFRFRFEKTKPDHSRHFGYHHHHHNQYWSFDLKTVSIYEVYFENSNKLPYTHFYTTRRKKKKIIFGSFNRILRAEMIAFKLGHHYQIAQHQ